MLEVFPDLIGVLPLPNVLLVDDLVSCGPACEPRVLASPGREFLLLAGDAAGNDTGLSELARFVEVVLVFAVGSKASGTVLLARIAGLRT